MDEWRVEHSERMDCWMDGDGLPLLVFFCSLLLLLLLAASSSSSDDEDGEANGFLDQLHVDENRIGEDATAGSTQLLAQQTSYMMLSRLSWKESTRRRKWRSPRSQCPREVVGCQQQRGVGDDDIAVAVAAASTDDAAAAEVRNAAAPLVLAFCSSMRCGY